MNKAVVGLLALIAWRQVMVLSVLAILAALVLISALAGNSGWVVLPVMLVLPVWIVARSMRRRA